MGNFLKKFGLIMPVSIIGIIWTILVLVFANYETANVFFWGGLIFGIITFAVTAVLPWFVGRKSGNTTVELAAPVYTFTAIYFIAGFILNTIFVIIATHDSYKWVIVPNVIFILLYVGAMVFALRTVTGVSEMGKKIDEKVVSVQMFGVQVAALIDLVEDASVKEQLVKLKEYVDYSDQVGVAGTKEIEDRFRTQLFDIQTMIDEGEPIEDIAAKVKSATSTWKTRNNMLATLR